MRKYYISQYTNPSLVDSRWRSLFFTSVTSFFIFIARLILSFFLISRQHIVKHCNFPRSHCDYSQPFVPFSSFCLQLSNIRIEYNMPPKSVRSQKRSVVPTSNASSSKPNATAEIDANTDMSNMSPSDRLSAIIARNSDPTIGKMLTVLVEKLQTEASCKIEAKLEKLEDDKRDRIVVILVWLKPLLMYSCLSANGMWRIRFLTYCARLKLSAGL